MGLFNRLSGKTEEVKTTINDVDVIKKEISNIPYSYSDQLESLKEKFVGIDLYCDQTTYWKHIRDIVKADVELSIGTKLCRVLYKTIITNPDNKQEQTTFIKFEQLLLNKELLKKEFGIHEFIDKFDSYYILFNDKTASYSILSHIFNDETFGAKERIMLAKEIMDFAVKVREYYFDEVGFKALLLDTIDKVKTQTFNSDNRISLYKEQERKAKHAAGFYDIDEVALAQTNKFVEQLQDKYESLVANIARTNTVLDDAQAKAVEDFKTATQGILANADKVIAEVSDVADSRKKQIDDLGTSIIRTINKFLDENPEAEEVLRTKDSGYNPLLDMSKPAKDRFASAIKNLSPTEFYQDSFNDALGYVLINHPVFLQGPTGCGKSHMAKQIAEVLGVPFYNIGFITDAWNEIKGWDNAAGNFEKTAFYDAYKYGGVAFIDEIDISNPQALMELNKITGEDGYEPYIFQNGECVTPHKNFRLVAAGNTFGRGGDQDYQRNALDISTLDRYEKVQVTYNEELEKTIMRDHQDIYNFLTTLREVATETNSSLLVTTKSFSDICKAYESDLFDLSKAFNGKLINGESVDALEELNREVISRIGKSQATEAFDKAIKLRKVK